MSLLLDSNIAYSNGTFLLIRPGMTFQIVVQSVVIAVEVLHRIVLIEAANDDGHSVLHRTNQGIGRRVSFPCGYQFGKILQFAPSPFDFHLWQGNAWSHSFQPRKKQY